MISILMVYVAIISLNHATPSPIYMCYSYSVNYASFHNYDIRVAEMESKESNTSVAVFSVHEFTVVDVRANNNYYQV